MIARLILRFLWERPWQFALAVALCALGLASAISIVWLQSLLETHARRQAQGIDIVVGAQGSALQNVLAAVYYLDVPNGNIRLAEVDALRANPLVANAIPIALGDSVAGARIVGTTPDYLTHYDAKFASGKPWEKMLEVVIGGQCFGDASLLHHDKRDAVGERPIFVRPSGEQSDPALPKISRCGYNRNLWILLQSLQEP